MRPHVTTAVEFTTRWRTPPNFRITSPLVPFEFQLPTAVDVLDRVRRDNAVRFTILGDDDWAVRMERTEKFRTAPLSEIVAWPFRLVHFDLARFYDDLFAGFQEQVMIPWRTFLASEGFTWQRCAPILFISTRGAASTYHNDNSHGLVWQVEGAKTFHSYLAPDRILSAEAAVIGETTAEEPPEHDPADRQSVRMEPGDQLWSHALTPHWVTTESPLALSITLAHGGLCHQGHYSERELALRAYWDDNPAEAWLHDLRNTRY
ncbi:hypothetical protein I5Q34_00385 [Streptomyces sp. AV19]|uniref:hypothetical protein n=1 Tax=Streptomyces sp. AV19 TaxID=2793068 RepID=UPI0018FE79D8|nr:hypothetical protein [Streptomyces sp. AV19]MBH1932765.1 hypothetical protein [Streptomyces sp. AV19]MDG4531436.1 hypothetical protein [Streptomyces sp. AV19]